MDLWFCSESNSPFPSCVDPTKSNIFSFYSALQPHQVLLCFLTNRFTEGEASKSLPAWMHRLCTKLILNLYNNSISVSLRKHKHHRTCSPADHQRSAMTLSWSLRCFCRGFMIYMEPLEAVCLSVPEDSNIYCSGQDETYLLCEVCEARYPCWNIDFFFCWLGL